MPWRIEPELAQARLRITTEGAIDFEQFVALTRDALAQARSSGVTRLLVDHRAMTPAVSTLEIHDMPSHLAQEGLDGRYRIATIPPQDSASRGNFEFFHALAGNRGEHHFRQFEDEAEASLWLSQD